MRLHPKAKNNQDMLSIFFEYDPKRTLLSTEKYTQIKSVTNFKLSLLIKVDLIS